MTASATAPAHGCGCPPSTELLDCLPDGFLVADDTGVVTCANDMARQLLGSEALVGRRLEEVMALQDLDGRDWWSVTSPYTGLSIRRLQAEQAWRLPDGTELLVTTRILRDGPRSPVRRIGVCLRSARARELLDKERSDLVATIAHELRSPLTGVKGFTGTLLARWDRFNDDQKKLIMQSVHTDTDRLTRLIAELLEVARIDTGRLSLHPRQVPVDEVAGRVIASIREGTARELRLDVAPGVPPLFADPDRLAQVLTNLVENGVRHGEGTVSVVVRATEVEGRRYVRLLVQDQGDGISVEIRRRVFTKFWKHGTRGGSGLGMYIVHGLVTASEGTITIGDAEGGGACIEVLWPAAVTADEPEAPEGGAGTRSPRLVAAS
jgi:signal transduction histidine kinase